MILVVLLNVGGLIAVLFALIVVFTAGVDAGSLSLAAPFVLSGLVLLGLAQVIHALIRTAIASEATLSEIQHIRTAQEQMSAVFERLGQKRN